MGRPLFAFPTHLDAPSQGENVDQEVFAFTTTEPNELTQRINHECMPAVGPADFETWLSRSTADAFKPARSYAADQMRTEQLGAEREDLLKVA